MALISRLRALERLAGPSGCPECHGEGGGGHVNSHVSPNAVE